MRLLLALLLLCLGATQAVAGPSILLRPARVFDGVDPAPHAGWQVLVEGDHIVAAGPDLHAPADARVIDLPGMTLMPGMIEGHGHMFLHPYNETSWDDQVLREPLAMRVARATVSARDTLMAGFTTERDLGTEGAGYADVGLRDAIDRGIVPGPRMIVATRAIVATGAYGPKLADPELADGTGRSRQRETILRPRIEAWASSMTPQEAAARLNAANVPAAPVQTVRDLFACPHLAAREMIMTLTDPVFGDLRVPGNPIKLGRWPSVPAGRIPQLGADQATYLPAARGLRTS